MSNNQSVPPPAQTPGSRIAALVMTPASPPETPPAPQGGKHASVPAEGPKVPPPAVETVQTQPVLPTGQILRIPATEIFPSVNDCQWPAKATAGEAFPVRATIFREGHDAYSAQAILYQATDAGPQEVSRETLVDIAPGLDRYEAWLCPPNAGEYTFAIETFSDPYATWVHDATVKIAAGTDTELMLIEGALLLERMVKAVQDGGTNLEQMPPADQQTLRHAAEILRDQSRSIQGRLSAGLSSRIRRINKHYTLKDCTQITRHYPVRVHRRAALYSAWYEIFPRSEGAWKDELGQLHPGTLRSAASRLPFIAGMGFDVVYLTPIHPIGTTYRKGRNNTPTAEPGEPGSPYGIGSADGGHDAIHPELGTWEDFDFFVSAARAQKLEVALDIALQCSPDHPWVAEHPEWFCIRADGTIAYAENPPKKYQDIYPLNFDNDPEGIYVAIRDMLEKWIQHGVTCFRVDNPHTKPLPFWQRLLEEMHLKHPEVIFLAEAFTRPAMMRTLGAVGFHQSYTYFTWRNTKEELTEYFTELAEDTAHVLRPSFWPTTHDILTPFMQHGGRAAFCLRAVLAATGAPTWGIYTGYEFVENVPRPGFEEQIDNEKYEIKIRDWEKADEHGLVTLLTLLNTARANHPALQQLRQISFHETHNDQIICYSKHVPAKFSPTGEADTVIVVVNLDPQNTQSTHVCLDLAALGLLFGRVGNNDALMQVTDELTGEQYLWGDSNYVELSPANYNAHVFAVRPL